MSDGFLSDVEARAVRRRTQTRAERWHELAAQTWSRATAATDPRDARRWLERAHRLVPADGNVALTLGARYLADRQPELARPIFAAVAERENLADAWAGLATCAHLMRDPDLAQQATARALQRSVPTETLRNLAGAVAGPAGWCGLGLDGVIHGGIVRPVRVRLDDAPVTLRRGQRLPPGWWTAQRLDVESAAGPMLGSPLPIAVFGTLEGVVEAEAGTLTGWAWHPADPARDPSLVIEGQFARRTLVARLPAEGILSNRALVRPRRFSLDAAEVARLGPPLSVRGPDGRHLLGSPLDPLLEIRAAADPSHRGFNPIWADVIGPPPVATPAVPVDVVIPVFRDLDRTRACIESVLTGLPRGARVIVVDDASPEPELAAWLATLDRRRRVVLVRLPENRGFPAACNAGLLAAAGRDVVLLNSDTLVPPGWLDRLRAAAYAAPDTGTVTPLTNDGTIVSYPDPAGGNPIPTLAETIALDALAQRANPGATIEVPVGVGFCLYIRRACLDDTGLLREDLFAQGYGEENDFCLRARHRGWRNVAAPGVFVAHVGGASFGAARAYLAARNGRILARLHPGYDDMVQAHIAADPLGPARRRIDALRWASARPRGGAVVLVMHTGGGGVGRMVSERAASAVASGHRAIILKPHRWGPAQPGVQVSAHDEPS